MQAAGGGTRIAPSGGMNHERLPQAIVEQNTRLDSRQAENALHSTVVHGTD